MSILKVENLSKKFERKEVLKNVSFDVNEGDILAFIGPNGAGKTTTIKCVLGLQKMNRGTVTINGYDIKKDFTKAIKKVGCIVESPDVYMYLTAYDNLKMQASLYDDITDKDIDEVIKMVGLENRIHDKVSKYSLGMRQRLGIAISLIHKPNLLILDEPTNGLDPEGIKDLRTLLKKLASEGMAILISSHNLSELESFCNKVLIISHGEVIEENTINEIKKTDDNKYLLKVSDIKEAMEVITNAKKIDKEHIEVVVEEKEIAEVIKKLVKNKIDIFEVRKEDISLEEAFINKAGGKKID